MADLTPLDLPSFLLPTAFQHNKHSNTSIIFRLGRIVHAETRRMWWQTVETISLLTTESNKTPTTACCNKPFFVLRGSDGLLKHDEVFAINLVD